ncbi:hypothetical protein [Streptomyces sp. NPDC046197]|uniref:hypothetical protein n=1 Tax=Streptomyces sp. NPDC046197 TaxID=3154337 RepID=UPI0033FAD718
MASDSENTTPIQSVWAQRCAGDLAANRGKQGEIAAQITDLQRQLEELQQEERWLVKWQASLPLPPVAGDVEDDAVDVQSQSKGGLRAGESENSAAVEAVGANEASAVPPPRQEDHSEPAQSKSSARKKAPAKKTAAKKATTKKTAAMKPTAEKKGTSAPEAGKPKQPGLQQLVLGILLKTPGEPHLAREVYDDLAKEHPDRATSVQSVRNTLETLVTKDTIAKTNQQGSAMYTAHGDSARSLKR